MSTDELLDLVDENDKVIGEILRSIANKHPQFIHREIGIVPFDEQGRALLQKRSGRKETDPSWWTVSCAGHVPKGFKPIEAALTELREELGFFTSLRFVKKFFLTYSTERHFAYLFVGKYSGQKIVLDRNEVKDVMFVTKKQFIEMEKVVEPISYRTILMLWKKKRDIVFS